ncbi:hypothetical protein ACFWUP_30995 [Nocardia sp. NPDC058658]|uniref:hypothetical protein n=1 Tax=Nocardia sp. NPDC058658 TaxID=3346580 RepID=UPI0036581CE7
MRTAAVHRFPSLARQVPAAAQREQGPQRGVGIVASVPFGGGLAAAVLPYSTSFSYLRKAST